MIIMKRQHKQERKSTTMVKEPEYTWLYDDIIEEILKFVLTYDKNNEKKIHYNTSMLDTATEQHKRKKNSIAMMITYFDILLVNKQFNRICKSINMNWLRLLCKISMNYRYPDKKIIQLPYSIDILKTIAYYDICLPQLRNEIDEFMKRYNIIYRTKASGKPYKGYVGIRKLHSMIIKPVFLQDNFRKLTKRYKGMNERRIILYNYLFCGVP